MDRLYAMPAPGEPAAPSFSTDRPRELRRYFGDLELLFGIHSIVSDRSKKLSSLRYTDIDTADLWRVVPQFDDAYSYPDFVTAIQQLYYDSDSRYSLADLADFIAKQRIAPIEHVSALGTYYRSFYAIAQFLRSKNRISCREQSSAFAQGFQPSLWSKIACRLELVFPDHQIDDVYPVESIYDAASFVLRYQESHR